MKRPLCICGYVLQLLSITLQIIQFQKRSKKEDGSKQTLHTRLRKPAHRGCDAANLLDALHMYVAW